MIRAALLWLALAGSAEAVCRQALTLGLDVSGSVDGREYRLQLDGLAAALDSPEVRDALFAGPGHVRLAVFEWSGPREQRLLLPWTEVTDPPALAAVLRTLRGTERVRAEPTTAIGAAMLAGGRLLAEQPGCWQRTLDLSGDGKSNTGPRPETVTAADLPPDIVINGLVIGAEADDVGRDRLVAIGEMVAYYDSVVIRGPDSFVEAALGFADYQNGMRRKLVRELRVIAIGDAPRDAAPPALR